MPHTERFLDLLNAIEGNERLTQRDIALRLKISLGQANALVHACMDNGWVTCGGSTNYRLTETGHEERYRLMVHRMKNTVEWYKDTQRRIRENYIRLKARGVNRVVFYGAGEVAEVAHTMLDGVSLELTGVVDDFRPGELFCGVRISPVSDLLKLGFDGILVTTFHASAGIREQVASLGLPLTLLHFFQ
jgi:hypothetical protein